MGEPWCDPFSDPVANDPIELARHWFCVAGGGQFMPQPMTLSTADAEGRPSTRTVMVKDVSADGFTFFTSYQSRKIRELERYPYASLLAFWASWAQLRRQISVTGKTRKTSAAISDAFFAGRTRRNQIVAWVSEQSSPYVDHAALAAKCAEFERQYEGRQISRPPHWGGIVLIPETIEFWLEDEQGLHNRLLFRRQGNGGWIWTRLSP